MTIDRFAYLHSMRVRILLISHQYLLVHGSAATSKRWDLGFAYGAVQYSPSPLNLPRACAFPDQLASLKQRVDGQRARFVCPPPSVLV